MEYNYFLLLPFTVIFAWALVFIQNGRVKELHDRLFLTGAICSVLTYYIVVHSLVEGTNSYHFILNDNIETLLGLSICPLLFLYIRSVVVDDRWHRWYLWLFVPAVLIAIAGTTLSFMVGWDRIIEIRMDGFHPFTPVKENIIEWLYYVVNIQIFDITIELMAVVMIALCVRYLIRYSRNVEHYYANIENASIGKIHCFLMSSTLNLIILFLLTFFILDIISANKYLLLGISFGISIFLWMMAKSAYGIIVMKGSLEVMDTLNMTEDVDMKPEHNNKIESILKQWAENEKKPFCQEGITILDVAKEMDISPRVLSAYINKYKGVNFYYCPLNIFGVR